MQLSILQRIFFGCYYSSNALFYSWWWCCCPSRSFLALSQTLLLAHTVDASVLFYFIWFGHASTKNDSYYFVITVGCSQYRCCCCCILEYADENSLTNCFNFFDSNLSGFFFRFTIRNVRYFSCLLNFAHFLNFPALLLLCSFILLYHSLSTQNFDFDLCLTFEF